MSAAQIAAALGRAQQIPGGGYLVPCPVASHGQGRGDRNPSLAIKDGDKGLLVRCFSGCDPRDVLDALRARGLLDGYRSEPRPQPIRPNPTYDEQAERERQRRKAAGLWAHRRPIKGSIAETYLRARGIACPLPFATLGFLPARKPDQHRALIAAFARHDEPEPGVLGLVRGLVDSVHLTLLKPDGSGKADVKHPKLIVGSPRGRPLELAAPNDLLGIAITEGIEDALTIHQATGLGVWAAGSAPFLPGLADAVPDWMDCVTIIVDRDDAGRRFSFQLAERLKTRGLRVELRELQ